MKYFPKLVIQKTYLSTVRKYGDETIAQILYLFLTTKMDYRVIEKSILKFDNMGYEVKAIVNYFGMSEQHSGLYYRCSYDNLLETIKKDLNEKNEIIEKLESLEENIRKLIEETAFTKTKLSTKSDKSTNDDGKEIELYNNLVLKVRNYNLQKKLRDELLIEFNGKCALCEINEPNLLIASHILPYSKCEGDYSKAANVNNTILLCVLHDALFESGGYITFVNGKIKISESLSSSMYDKYLISPNMHIDEKFLNREREEFLKIHNELFAKYNVDKNQNK